MPRRFLICLAFATLCFANTWVALGGQPASYFARYNPLRISAIPVLCLEAAITLALLAGWELARRYGRRHSILLQRAFLAACLFPLGIIAATALQLTPSGAAAKIDAPVLWPAAALVAALALLAYEISQPRSGFRFVEGVLLGSWPLLAIFIVQACTATLLRHPDAAYADDPPAARLPAQPGRPRALWIVFDEMSQTVAFTHRPPDLAMPNLDRFARESFFATNAEPPAGSTVLSMPSLITGDAVRSALPDGPRDSRLKTAEHPGGISWRAATNVFDAARALGYNTGLVGWANPYGRILNRSLTECYWTAQPLESGIEEAFQPESLAAAMRKRARLQLLALPIIGRMPRGYPGLSQKPEKIRRFAYLRQHAVELAADGAMGLVLLHLPVPHAPAIYDRRKGVITADGPAGYVDSLALADKLFGELRAAMETSGVWDRTAVLISADHGWRTRMWREAPGWSAEDEAASANLDTSRVPFVLKLPHQDSGVTYGQPFNTVVTRRILTGILGGHLTEPSEVPKWLEPHAGLDSAN